MIGWIVRGSGQQGGGEVDNSAQTSPAECLGALASCGSCSLNSLMTYSSDSYIAIQFGPSLVVDVPLIYKCRIY